MSQILRDPFIIRLLITVAVLLAAGGIRFLVARRITAGAHILNDTQRRQLFYLRTSVTAAILVALLFVWAGALQNLLLSLTAVMVALVIATKELLMCLSGFLLRTTGRLFSVGDWIECNGLRGEVTDQTLLSTQLLEVEAPESGYNYTGRMLSLPNSMFLTHPVHTSPFARQHVTHRFAITMKERAIDPESAQKWLQAEAERACSPFIEEARRINESMDRRFGVDVAGPEPMVSAGTTDLGDLRFRIRVFCPREQAAGLEREISTAFLGAVQRGEIACPTPVQDQAQRDS